MKGFQTDIQKERILRGLDGAQVAHQLGGRLCDICAFSELLRIHDAVIRLIRRREPREFAPVGLPVKIATVHDRTAHTGCMAVHILCRGMGHDIRTPLERPAVDRRGECIVHDERNAVRMGRLRKFLEIKNDQRRVRDGLSEHGLRIVTERRIQFFF